MPVRIYDIAKKLGIESKEVLAKAKELGIASARVPSSSLDKITAEFLEGHFTPVKAAPVAPPAPTAPDPILLVKPPPLPVPAEPTPVELPAPVEAITSPPVEPPPVHSPVVEVPPPVEAPVVEMKAPVV